MAQRPSHRLNLYLVPAKAPDEERLDAGLAELSRLGVVSGMKPGPRAEDLVDGGFAMLRVDRPGRIVVYGNRQGGYRVRCPGCGANQVPAFSAALPTLSRVRCEACEREHPIRGLRYEPPVAFGALCVELRDVGAPELKPWGHELMRSALGDFDTIGSRG